MSIYEEKFKNLKFKENDKNKNSNYYESREGEKLTNSKTIFKELLANLTKEMDKEQIFLFILMIILKNKKASNELILALFYISM